MLDGGPIIKCVKPGDKIKMKERHSKDEEEKQYTYTIIKVYPFMVLAERKNQIKRCFSYGDLVVLGLERQPVNIEAMRMFSFEDVEKHRGRATDYSRKEAKI